MDKLRESHDAALLEKPELAVHDKETCPFCNESHNANDDPTERGDMGTEKTYTEAELNTAVQAAVDAALTPVQAELSELKTAQDEAEIDARITQAKADGEAAVEAVKSELDDAKVELAAAKTELENTVAFLKAEVDSKAAAELAEERKTTRLAEIASVASLDEDYVNANIDRWAEKSDEDFADLIEGWKAIAGPTKTSTADAEISSISATAMTSAREVDQTGGSAFKDILNARRNGLNIHKI